MKNKWFLIPQTNPDAVVRLFCFPFAGGGASAYYHWHKNLPPFVELIGIQLPGRENRTNEPYFQCMTSLVDVLFRQIQPFLNIRFLFYGHSIGALLAFELARRLRRENCDLPEFLLVSASKPPQTVPHSTIATTLPEKQFIEKISIYENLPTQLLADTDFRKMVIQKLRADISLLETYTYTPERPFEFPIVAYSGESDPVTSTGIMEQWRCQTNGPFVLKVIPGGHFFIKNSQSIFLSEMTKEIELSCQNCREPVN